MESHAGPPLPAPGPFSSSSPSNADASSSGHSVSSPVETRRAPSPPPDATDKTARRPRKEKTHIALAPDQPPTTQGKPRTRVYVACLQCRSRKIRCDGARPVCHNCGQRGENDCNYDSAPKRRGPDKVQGARTRTTKRKEEEGVPVRRKRRRTGSTANADHVVPTQATTSEADGRPPLIPDSAAPFSPIGIMPNPFPVRRKVPIPPNDILPSGLGPPGSNVRFTSTSVYDEGLLASIASDSHMLSYDHTIGFTPITPYVDAFAAPGLVSSAHIKSTDEAEEEESVFNLGAEPSVQFSRKIWWDHLLYLYSSADRTSHAFVPALTQAQRDYSMGRIVHDLRFLFKTTNYWFSFFNVPRFFNKFLDPVKRSRMQPSLVLSALMIGTYLQSSQLGRGDEGRRLALMLRDEAQGALDASLAARSIDEELAEAAWMLAFFEICAHPQHHNSRVFSSMALCDAIIRTLCLTTLDEANPQASAYSPRTMATLSNKPYQTALESNIYASSSHEGDAMPASIPLGIEPSMPSLFVPGDSSRPRLCSCESMFLGQNWPEAHSATPFWIATPAWNWEWTEGEVRKEECRRLAWSAMMLAAGISSFTTAVGTRTMDYFVTHPSNFALLFPGETLLPQSYSNTGFGKKTVWALYLRAMMLWHTCYRLRQDSTMNDTENSEFAMRAWLETEEIEKALNRHTCGVERAFMFVGREYLFNTRMCISYEFQRFIPHVLTGLSRDKASEWLYDQEQRAKAVMQGMHAVTGNMKHDLAQRPWFVWWFMGQVARALALWKLDNSLTVALDVSQAFLEPIEFLASVWPCAEQRARYNPLAEEVRRACLSAQATVGYVPSFGRSLP
ncbi:hypothetical protein DENSPDRAFT_915286 [Dentipellis sp. KUC8613]|nr:hypothetical protein DENSPDRAFT_915286 [Dentipellis sp. KUC8613]